LKDWSKDSPQIFQFPGGQGENFVWSSGTGRQIGVSVYTMTKQLGERYGVDGGVMINEVRPDSPGARAGLKAGDIVIEVDGKPVRNNFDLIKAVNAKASGDVQLTIMRDRNRQTISVTPEISKDGGFFFKHGDDDNGLMFPPMPPAAPMIGRPATPAPHAMPAPGIAPAMRLMRPARVI
jgi:membrane-associated protease RseP (regulator of RpoE activity)